LNYDETCLFTKTCPYLIPTIHRRSSLENWHEWSNLSMKEDKDQEEQVIFEKELDQYALDVIKQLYDKTFKELVDR
jgi:serine/threonine-protein kinase RIO1